MMSPTPDVAIILLTKNSKRWLDEVLAAIFGQQTRHTVEVIAVDSGSRDGTAERLRAEAAAGRLRLYAIPPESFQHGRTRNFGASEASPSVEYLVFLSHDATPTPGWLDALIAPLEADPNVAGAHSRHIPRPTCPPPQARLLVTEWLQSGTPERVVKRLADLPPGEYERNQHYWAHFSDTASVVRRSVWEQHPIPEVDFAEDAAWADRVLRAGYTLVYEPTSTVIHSHDYGLWRQLKQNVDHARAMKERFDPPAYKESHPTRTVQEVVRRWRLDCAYIWGMAVPWWHKPILMLHSPLWHLATHAGIKLGIWWDRLPRWAQARLSHQGAVQRGELPHQMLKQEESAVTQESTWGERFGKAFRYFAHGEWRELDREVRQFITWKFPPKSVRFDPSLSRLRPLPVARQQEDQSWQKLYKHPLLDLGDLGNETLRGVYSPGYDESLVRQYVQSQFLEFAHIYRDKYQNIGYFRHLILTAFNRIGFDSGKEMCVLDIGSGAGNSIFPLLDLCPNAFVIASDLSVELLVLLKQALETQAISRNVVMLQLNAEELEFQPESFDLVVGAAILHHLLSPEKTIQGCAKILKKDGYAIFFEPFEAGGLVLRSIYDQILSDERRESLLPEVRNFLQGMVRDYDVRQGLDKSAPIYRQIDDKWLFPTSYFRELAERYRFSQSIVYPLHSTERQFESQAITHLRIGLGKGREVLPEWAWEILRQHDQRFSEDEKRELMLEGCVILKK